MFVASFRLEGMQRVLPEIPHERKSPGKMFKPRTGIFVPHNAIQTVDEWWLNNFNEFWLDGLLYVNHIQLLSVVRLGYLLWTFFQWRELFHLVQGIERSVWRVLAIHKAVYF